MTFGRWLGITGTLIGSYYVFMLLGVMLHETAHGFAAEAYGGTWFAFDINPGLGGWAWTDGVADEHRWIVTWAGLAVDFVTGGIGLLWLLLLRPHLTTPRVLLLTFTVGGLGSALGYTLQGFLFLKGDSAGLAESLSTPARVLSAVVIGALLLLCVAWGLRRIIFLLEEHYEPRGRGGRFLAISVSVLLPWLAFLLLKPGVKVYDEGERLRYYGVLTAVMLVAAFFFTRHRPLAADPAAARPPRALTGALWFGIAAACYVATETWLRDVKLA